jgi:hypothetical protein
MVLLEVWILLNFGNWVGYGVIGFYFVGGYTFKLRLFQLNIMNIRYCINLPKLIYKCINLRTIFNWVPLRWLEICKVPKCSIVEFLVCFVSIWYSVAIEVVWFSYFDSVFTWTRHIIDISVPQNSRKMLFWVSESRYLHRSHHLWVVL